MTTFTLLYVMALLVVFAVPFAFSLLAVSVKRAWAQSPLVLAGAILGGFAAVMLLRQGGLAFGVSPVAVTQASTSIVYVALGVMVALTLIVHFRSKKDNNRV